MNSTLSAFRPPLKHPPSSYWPGLITIAGFIIFLLYYAVIISMPLFFSFEDIVQWNANHLPEFHVATSDDYRFTERRYHIAQVAGPVIFGCLLLFSYLVIRYRKRFHAICVVLGEPLRFAVTNLIAAINKTPLGWKIALLLLLITSVILRSIQYDYVLVHNDEIATYHYFVSQGLTFTTVQYSMPNNHVFFNQLFILFKQVISDPLLAGRMVSLLAFHSLLLIAFYQLIRITNSYISSFLGVMAICLLFPSSVYAVLGRGYMLAALLLLVSYLFLDKALQSGKKGYYVWFSIFASLGAFTIPIFLIPIISAYFFALIYFVYNRKFDQIKPLLVNGCLTGLIILFLYLPILLFSGPDAIFFNEMVSQENKPDVFWSQFPIHSAEIFSFFVTTTSKGWLILTLFFIIGCTFIKKLEAVEKRFLTFTIIVILTLFAYGILMKTFFPFRTLTIYPAIIYMAMAIITGRLLHAAPGAFRYGMIVCILILLPYRSISQYTLDPFSVILPDQDLRTFDNLIEQNRDVPMCFQRTVREEFYYQYLHYLRDFQGLVLINDPVKAGIIIVVSQKEMRKDLPEEYEMMLTYEIPDSNIQVSVYKNLAFQ